MADRRSPALSLFVAGGASRKVGWLELFYDLVFVVAIIQLGDVLAKDLTVAGTWKFAGLFAIVWWSWIGATLFFNRVVADDLVQRLLVFAQMFAMANVAITVEGAFGDASLSFAASIGAIRVAQLLMHVRAAVVVADARPFFAQNAWAYSLSSACWFTSMATAAPVRHWVWALTVAIEVGFALSPQARRQQRVVPVDRQHLVERVGLFSLIVFGEAFVKGVSGLAGTSELTLTTEVFLALGFVVVASLWWAYFNDLDERSIDMSDGSALIWLYAHLPLTASLAALGVGVKKPALHELGSALPEAVFVLIGITTALSLASIAATQYATMPGIGSGETAPRARLVVAALIVVLLAVGRGLPGLAAMGLLAALTVSQAAIGSRQNERPPVRDAGGTSR